MKNPFPFKAYILVIDKKKKLVGLCSSNWTADGKETYIRKGEIRYLGAIFLHIPVSF